MFLPISTWNSVETTKPDRHTTRYGIRGAWPLQGCSWPPVQADPPTVARPRAGVGQPCPRPASCLKGGACRAPDFVPQAAGHFGQTVRTIQRMCSSQTQNRIPWTIGDETDETDTTRERSKTCVVEAHRPLQWKCSHGAHLGLGGARPPVRPGM